MATVLYVELRNGLAPSALLAVAQLAVSALIAVLLGNIVRECAFEVCSALTTYSGRAFFREGITVAGVKFEEVHYPGGTWFRCESGSEVVTCEWTEPDGRCSQIKIRAGAEGMTCYTSAPSPPRCYTNPSLTRNIVYYLHGKSLDDTYGLWAPSAPAP
jgi:hypothetical protein